MAHNHEVSFAREAVVSMLVVVGLYFVSVGAQFPPLQIPGYLLIVGFDMLEVTFGSASEYYDVLFAAYLLGLGLVGAVLVHGLRTRTPGTVPSWRLGVAGALIVVGILSLLFATVVSSLTPFLITGTTGLILLALAGWLVGLFDSETTATSE
jgi:hypothetical protein